MTRRYLRACMMVMFFSFTLTGCETVKKLSQVIKNPDIQVGKLADQTSEVTITLLTEPDTNTNADGEASAVDIQLVYMSDDSKLQAADYDQIASVRRCRMCWVKTISTTRTLTCCQTLSKPCRQ